MEQQGANDQQTNAIARIIWDAPGCSVQYIEGNLSGALRSAVVVVYPARRRAARQERESRSRGSGAPARRSNAATAANANRENTAIATAEARWDTPLIPIRQGSNVAPTSTV